MQQIGTCVIWKTQQVYEDELARRVAEHSRVHAREDHGEIVDRAEFEHKGK